MFWLRILPTVYEKCANVNNQEAAACALAGRASEEIYPLNEWTDLSLFDTDILSDKAHQAGFTLAVCRDLFIHHFGTRTFAQGAPRTEDHPSGNGQHR